MKQVLFFFNHCVCAHVCVGGLVVKRGCQSSCQTDNHSSLLCNSLISLLSSETHTHTHAYRCTRHANFTRLCIHIWTQQHTQVYSCHSHKPRTDGGVAMSGRGHVVVVVRFSSSQSSADCREDTPETLCDAFPPRKEQRGPTSLCQKPV